MVYMVSAMLVAGVFVLLAAAVMVAKISALMMMIGIFFVLVMALLPNASMSKIAEFGKQYVGLSVFAWGAQLIMSILALITGILVTVGNQIVPGGPGDVMAIAWVGFAPLIAVFCLHFMFKKMKIPSPLKMSGGMAWGKMAAAGAVGGAAGMGAGALMNKAGNRVKSGAVTKGKQVQAKITGKDRRNKMTPGGGPVETKGGAGKATSPEGEAPSTGGVEDMTKVEKKKAVAAAKAEEKKVKDFAATPDGEKVLGTRVQRAKAAAGAKVSSAAQAFKDKPLVTTKNGLKKAAIVGVGATALAASGGTLGLVAGAAMYAGARGVEGKAKRDAQMLRGEPVSRDVENFRAHQAEQRAKSERLAAEQKSLGNAYETNKEKETDAGRQTQRDRMEQRVGGVTAGATGNGEEWTTPSIQHLEEAAQAPAKSDGGKRRLDTSSVQEAPAPAASGPRGGRR